MTATSVTYPAKHVANWFLKRAKKDGRTINPMAIHKLVYFAHGWSLGVLERPLINEQIEAWKYGPVVPSLYHEFKQYGNGPIKKLAKEDPDQPTDFWDDNQDLLERIWEEYGRFTAIQLSNMTHEEGGPWKTVYDEYEGQLPLGTDIPRKEIQDHFRAKIAAED